MFVEVNLLDVGLITLLIIFVVKGRNNGLFLEMVHIGGFFIALVASLRMLPTTSKWVNRIIELSPNVSVITGFALSFSLILLLYQFVVAFILKNSKVQIEEWLNRLGGLLLGLLKGANVVSMLCMMIILFPFARTMVDAQETSYAFRPGKKIMPIVYSIVKRVVPGSPDFETIVETTFLGFDLSDLDSHSKQFVQEYGTDHAKEICAATNK
jgi:membrane protein required for colicin V production